MRDARNDERRGRSNVNPIDILEGFLLDDLAAATHPLTGATTARIQIVRWDNDDEFYETDLIETVTNRSRSYSATAAPDYRDEADILQIQFINGEWRPQAGGGGARNDWIEFVITSWLPDISLTIGCEGVYAVVTSTSCNSIAQEGDEVMVWDPRFCWFNLPTALLPGTYGTAFWGKRPDDMGDVPCVYGPEVGSCMWIVKQLCCREEVYGE